MNMDSSDNAKSISEIIKTKHLYQSWGNRGLSQVYVEPMMVT